MLEQKNIERKVVPYILFGLIFVAPLFFIPSSFYSLEFSKNTLIVLGVLVLTAFTLISAFKQKKLILPPRLALVSLSLIAISVLASVLYSHGYLRSLFGQGFEVNTASFLLTLCVAVFVVFNVGLRNTKNTFTIYLSILASFLVLFVFHLLRIIFGADFISLGIFNSLTSSPLGSWMDISMLSSLVMLLAISALQFLQLPVRVKIVSWIVTILALIPVLLIHNSTVLIGLCIVLVGMIVYVYIDRVRVPDSTKVKALGYIPRFASIILIILLASALFGNSLVSKANTKLGTGYSSVTLSWRTTLDIVAGSIKTSPVLGIGPNNFSIAYNAFRPASINQGNLWSLEFSRGNSWIATFVATQGIFGILAWLVLFGVCAYIGRKMLSHTYGDQVSKFTALSSFFALVLLSIFIFIDVPGHVLLLLFAVFLGIYLASAVGENVQQEVVLSLEGAKKVSTYVVAIFCIILVVWAVFGVRKIIGMSYFASGIKHMTAESKPELADTSFASALKVDSSNVYWQARTEVALSEIRTLLSSITSTTKASTTASTLAEAGKLANQALFYAEKAIALDPYNYYNYVSKARVGEMASLLKMDKAPEVTIASYKQAIALNVQNPEIYLNLARFLASQKNYAEALKVVGAALDVKNNYIDAIYLLSQIQAQTGDLKNAIISAKTATQINPNNPLLFFQEGILEYNAGSYNAAVTSLKKAVELNSEYANARYFLGLSYARLGNSTEAIAQFQLLANANPTNTEVTSILSALTAGKDIFKSPAVDEAEKSSTLPIKQK